MGEEDNRKTGQRDKRNKGLRTKDKGQIQRAKNKGQRAKDKGQRAKENGTAGHQDIRTRDQWD